MSTSSTTPEAGQQPEPTPAPLKPERLAEIRERAEAATPGPWGTYFDHVVYDVVADLQPNSSGYSCRRQIAELRDEPIDNDPAHRDWTAEEDATQIFHDATFITRARNDVPALLAEVERLTAELDKLAHELDGASLSLREEEQTSARLRLAYRSARERAAAYGEGILRVVGDRESYQGWLKEAETAREELTARVAELEGTPPRRRLTPNEYSAAWHAIEGGAGEEGADPATILNAALARLDIDGPEHGTLPGWVASEAGESS